MINYHKEIKSNLDNILPTHYELFLHSKLATPCISYMELSNIATEEGNTLGYSRIQYQIKVWGNDLGEIQTYAQKVDEVMRTLGFKRVGGAELADPLSTLIQKILTYEALGLEQLGGQ